MGSDNNYPDARILDTGGISPQNGGIMLKKYQVVAAVFFVFLFFAAFPSAWSYEANFTYKPGDSLKKGFSGNVIMVGGVSFRSNTKVRWSSLPQLAKLDGAIKNDVTTILRSKGLEVGGQGAYLLPIIEITAGGPPVYSLSDIVVKIEGKITLELKPSLDSEAAWSKSVECTLASFQGPDFWKRIDSVSWKEQNAQQIINNTSVPKNILSVELSSEAVNDVVRGLEMQYSGLMGDLASSIDAKEIRSAMKSGVSK